VIPDATGVDAQLKHLGISPLEMVCCDINAGLRIWSDFGIHGDGYGRLLVTAGDVGDGERGRIIQRVQELGNYRNLALLGFPTVQKNTGRKSMRSKRNCPNMPNAWLRRMTLTKHCSPTWQKFRPSSS
jgi:uncharacterized membrane-anchored protein